MQPNGGRRDLPEVTASPRSPSAIQRAEHRQAAAVEHMGVDHGGLHVSMAEQLLHSADVLSRLQQVGGKTVTQGMRGYLLDDAGPPGGALEVPLHPFLIQMMATHRP
uniref:Uncharacterized protein n=1 Tax=Ectopseudomonas mendocina (strain ymp) TaxID=399739 RepID=A4XWW2_ECTM1